MNNYNNPRINLNDNPMSCIMKMAGGNPGAMRVLMDIFAKAGDIDPDDFMGGLGPILSMDSHGIYEHRIWMLYKDVCGQDLVCMLGLLRAVQLGMLSDATLDRSIDGTTPLSEDAIALLLEQVKERLPAFGVVHEVILE